MRGSDGVGANQYFVELHSEEENNEGKSLALVPKPMLPVALINQFQNVNLKRGAEESLSSRCNKKIKIGGGSVTNSCSDRDTVSDCTSPPLFDVGTNKCGRKFVKKRKGENAASKKLDVGALPVR